GAVSSDEMVLGTYLHGIFDNDEFRNHFINCLRKRKGLDEVKGTFNEAEWREKEMEKLAKTVKENIDMEKIRGMLNA
ncbi:cobyric acid synthase CobQ, partial [Candidatus Woesearchaeota archaeon]|nr:cobyric acid synthase CobQ [Candidatus Woesearchaeota archaeon]